MKQRSLILAGAALAIGMLAMPTTASASHRWQPIGVQQVDGLRDRDVVRVPGRERFRQIRLCVYRGPVRFRDLDVRFVNGRLRDLPIRRYFRAGTCTRAIDLPGRHRKIAAITMRYGNAGYGRHGWRDNYRRDSRYDRRHGRRWRARQPIVVIYGR